MNYLIEIFDTWDRRVAVFDEVPLLKLEQTFPDKADSIRGILPDSLVELGPGYRVRVWLDGEVYQEAIIGEVQPQWSDARKLILDRFVRFHEVFEFEAKTPALEFNGYVARGFENESVDAVVKAAINTTRGAVHYWVDHTAYPEGATREYSKFLARKTAGNELETGGISSGQWVGSARMDLTNAFAKDGDTIAGLKVDGVDWPDLRFMLIDSEETSLNSHTKKIHPETADWTSAQYDKSGYKIAGDKATDFLQNLIDTKGIDYIELNPHRGSDGNFDDRVDKFGRYLGLIFGGGECFNAAMVEAGHAEVLLFEDGKFHMPEMELKDEFPLTRDRIWFNTVATGA